MGLFDSLLNKKDLLKNIEGMMGNNELLSKIDLKSLAGNKNLLGAITALAANKEFTSKLALAKDDAQVKDLLDTATAALKDMKLTEEEKKELMEKVKGLVSKK